MAHYWTEVAVRGVVIDPLTGDPAILLQDRPGNAVLTVPADPAGAESIICQLEGINSSQNHSLAYRLLVRHEMRILRVEIGSDVHDNVSAAVCYAHNDVIYRIDVLPADGISLAIQSCAPMYASAELIADRNRTVNTPRVGDNSDLLIFSPNDDRTRPH